jgi:hypothetical protein
MGKIAVEDKVKDELIGSFQVGIDGRLLKNKPRLRTMENHIPRNPAPTLDT